MIKTGYFAKQKYYKARGFYVVSISRWSPKWFSGVECKELAPSVSLLSDYKYKNLSEEEYERRFRLEMNPENVKRILDSLVSEYGDKICLCCYEKNGDFCHRHILADIMKENYGMIIEELI